MTENSENHSEHPEQQPQETEALAQQGASEEETPTDPLQDALDQAAQMKEKWMRAVADLDNYRKRARREVTEAEKKGRDSLLRDLLPVFDNLERATAHADTASEASGDVKGLVDGITLVMKQFHDALSRLGIERVSSVGEPFDPGLHEAIQHLETAEFEPGCVAAEVQPGYREGERLLRPALVVVAKAPVSAEPVTESSSSTDESAESGTQEPTEA